MRVNFPPRSLSTLVLAIALASGSLGAQQPPAKPAPAKPTPVTPAMLAARLPAAIRVKATALLKSKEVAERVRLANELTREERARAFLIAQLPVDRDVLVRRAII